MKNKYYKNSLKYLTITEYYCYDGSIVREININNKGTYGYVQHNLSPEQLGLDDIMLIDQSEWEEVLTKFKNHIPA